MGPWDQGFQFGGASAALAVCVADALGSLTPMRVARVTVDLMRPIPIRPLELSTRVVRDGKRLQVVELVLRHEDQEVAWVSVLRLQQVDLSPLEPGELPLGTPAPAAHPTPIDPHAMVYSHVPWVPGITGAVDFWVPEGEPHAFRGPTWLRLHVPVVAGEATPPEAALALMADFSSGIGHPRWSSVRGINGDLTVSILRPPTDEWIVLEAESWAAPDGIGHSRSTLRDTTGVLAGGTCSRLLVRLPDRWR